MKRSEVRVAIHQPNFMPWLGFFNKIANVDIFVYLDDAQMPKKSSWLNRSLLLANSKKVWATIPIKSYHGMLRINEIEYSSSINWRERHSNLLYGAYSTHPYFPLVADILQKSLQFKEVKLELINKNIIENLLDMVDLNKPEFISSTSLNVTSSGTERLCELIRSAGGTTYYCGGGSKGYLKEETFSSYGLSLKYQNFKVKEYPQRKSKEFVPGLSIVDLVMNCGLQNASKYIV